jgi:predicted ribosome quality control (RQC) complex YloA/Tae2 family protein
MLQFQQKLNSPHEKEIKKLLAIIDTQKKQLVKLNSDEEEERKKAELIYSNYTLVKELIDEINKASKKYSFKEIKEKLKGHKIIKEVNSKDKTLVVELQ